MKEEKEREHKYPVADFYEPLKFEWTEQKHRIREAAKKFAESALHTEETGYNDVEQC